MNMEEAMTQAEKCCSSDDIRSQSVLASGAMVADAINRLAKAQERLAKAQEKQIELQEQQWALTSGVMRKMGPVMDKTLEAMSDEMEGENWKRRGSQGFGDNDLDNHDGDRED